MDRGDAAPVKRLALCVSASGIRSVHYIEMGATIPHYVAQRKVIMVMAITVHNQQFARRWASEAYVRN